MRISYWSSDVCSSDLKAAFLGSDLFNAGQTVEQVERDDLQRTYTSLEPLIPELKADIDREAKTVSVAFDETLPPRVAAWRQHLGCAQLSIGADPASTSRLPRLSVNPAIDRSDRLPWPNGDRNATARPDGDAKALGKAIEAAFDRRTYGQGSETTAVPILQHGKIVAEPYRGDFAMHTSHRHRTGAQSAPPTPTGPPP